jgi:hypothetical protein
MKQIFKNAYQELLKMGCPVTSIGDFFYITPIYRHADQPEMVDQRRTWVNYSESIIDPTIQEVAKKHQLSTLWLNSELLAVRCIHSGR